MISEEVFAKYSLIIFVGGLISYMAFIIYKMGKESNAGKYGMMILFIALFAGVLGFIIKTIVVRMMGI